MALETGTYIDDLDSANPTATDNVSQGDDHIRLIKSTVKATFPNIAGAMTATEAELNIMDGVTATTTEINNVCDNAVTAGTFTPTLQDASLSDGEGQTYTTQDGTYTRIGDRIFFELHLVLSNDGTLTVSDGANISLGALPNAAATAAVYVGRGAGLNLDLQDTVTGYIESGTNYVRLQNWDTNIGTSNLLINEFTPGTTGTIVVSGTYPV